MKGLEMDTKILIVEDNKTLAKLISKKLESVLDIEVDVAYTMAEAKLFIAHYSYFIALLDVNLPDAPNGEIIDFAIEKKMHAVVLSGNVDKNFRKKILKRNIIDYVNKGGVEDINYIIQTIQRLQNNQNHKVLVVDDDRTFSNAIRKMLENLFFQVINVSNGEEALGMLEKHPDISLVLTDYAMPVLDGLELTREIRKTYTKSELSVLALSGIADEETTALFLKHGANDYIKKPFSKEEFSCRINNVVEALENIQKITNYANRDFLTGLFNRRHFFAELDRYIEKINGSTEQFAVGMIDIDYFKKINDKYGHDSGDKVLISLADILKSSTNPHDIIARFGGEEFCVVLKDVNPKSTQEIFNRLKEDVEKFSYELNNDISISFTISIGVVLFNQEKSAEDNINEADALLYKAKNSGRNRVVFEA